MSQNNDTYTVYVMTRHDRSAASSRLRFFQYISFLESRGVNVVESPLLDDNYLTAKYSIGRGSFLLILASYFARIRVLLLLKRKADVVWLQGELFPYLPAIFEYYLRVIGCRIVVDYDDAIFHKYDSSSNFLVKFFLKNKIKKVMGWAYCVVVGNEYLQQYAISAGADRTLLLPTVVDIDRYSAPDENFVSGGEMILGWIGSPTTGPYLLEIADALEEVARRRKIVLRLVGCDRKTVSALSQRVTTESYEWTEAGESELVSSFTIGLMPLTDGSWEKGKCGYKLIQYLACEVPVVATYTEANMAILRGEAGFLVAKSNDLDGWVNSILRLLDDRKLARSMGKSGSRIVADSYSVQSRVDQLANLLLEASVNPGNLGG